MPCLPLRRLDVFQHWFNKLCLSNQLLHPHATSFVSFSLPLSNLTLYGKWCVSVSPLSPHSCWCFRMSELVQVFDGMNFCAKRAGRSVCGQKSQPIREPAEETPEIKLGRNKIKITCSFRKAPDQIYIYNRLSLGYGAGTPDFPYKLCMGGHSPRPRRAARNIGSRNPCQLRGHTDRPDINSVVCAPDCNLGSTDWSGRRTFIPAGPPHVK